MFISEAQSCFSDDETWHHSWKLSNRFTVCWNVSHSLTQPFFSSTSQQWSVIMTNKKLIFQYINMQWIIKLTIIFEKVFVKFHYAWDEKSPFNSFYVRYSSPMRKGPQSDLCGFTDTFSMKRIVNSTFTPFKSFHCNDGRLMMTWKIISSENFHKCGEKAINKVKNLCFSYLQQWKPELEQHIWGEIKHMERHGGNYYPCIVCTRISRLVFVLEFYEKLFASFSLKKQILCLFCERFDNLCLCCFSFSFFVIPPCENFENEFFIHEFLMKILHPVQSFLDARSSKVRKSQNGRIW